MLGYGAGAHMVSCERALRLRSFLLPGQEDLGWTPFLWLFYLGFLFIPLIGYRFEWRWFGPTLASLPVFLVFYFRLYRRDRRRTLLAVLPIALLGYALTPFNPAAFTYLVFVGAAAPYLVRGLAQALALTMAALGVQAIEMVYLRQQPIDIAICAFVVLLVCLVNHFQQVAWRRNAALRISQDEVRRLAAVAERERIGRDLHDLLGHTLSLIAVKSELAGKLIERDHSVAAREIGSVTEIARAALAQVRTAVTGIRSATLESELVSAQALLESSGVRLTWRRDEATLPPQAETALALTVREAATNIQRHSSASRAHIEVTVSPAESAGGARVLTLLIRDDGRGGALVRGNGLTGIGERMRSLGGSLRIDSLQGHGTVLLASLPLGADTSVVRCGVVDGNPEPASLERLPEAQPARE
ncbi:MAG: histidine kinase [Steroidobacteraceae bacterium]